MIKLLALDLDGTLFGDDLVISPRVRMCIAEAQNQEVIVTLATGRMFDFTRPIAQDLGITVPLITYQGGLIQAPDDDAPLYQATMDARLVSEILTWQAQREGTPVLYAGDSVYLQQDQHWSEDFLHGMVGERLIWVDDLFSVLDAYERLIKLIIVAEASDADRIEAETRGHFGHQVEVVRSHTMFVEVNPPGVTKGNALARLAAHLAVPQAQVMALGDQGNDETMVAWAGLGVAMGNASPAVKAVADWIAPPLAEDGAAVAIEHFVLNASRS
ncbi:MAG TPA: HAD family phosphatase [Chloroflexi bacterium]|nr:HAD family phosphatase [Chloroflexota bacterium]